MNRRSTPDVIAAQARRSAWRRCCAFAFAAPIIALMGMQPAPAQQAKTQHICVLATGKGPYAEAAQILVRSLESAGHKADLLELNDGDASALASAAEKLRSSRPSLIAAAGPNLTTLALDTVPDVPVVFFMVPNALDASFLNPAFSQKQRIAGVACDVAPAAQIEFIRRLQPDCRKLGVLTSEHTRATVAALVVAGKENGVEITPVATEAEKFAAGLDELRRGGFQGVLMLPDAQVYNSTNVQGLLLWGVRDKCAVWGFSDKIVKAGALGGIYSDPADVGREAAQVINQIFKGKAPAEIGLRYPSAPRRGVNVHTAELIGAHHELFDKLSDVERFGENK